ncbi:MAG: spondin domain-containing protein [Desulfobacterales bacterium]|nr:MAG: spondin domain-containing protein [Desulfobacterales bacterium]
MKQFISGVIVFFIVLAIVPASEASYSKQAQSYKVTITNITRGQIISPPLVISHSRDFRLFNLGEEAMHGLDRLAEDADTGPLTDFLATQPSVFDFKVGDGPIMPGASVSVEIKAKRGFRFLSLAGMLVTTNDAFFAVRGVRVPLFGEVVEEADAYDAGSEQNKEICDYIPGPPCGNANVHDPDPAEGYVHIHAGIHGSGDLDPSEFDWRNPVAVIVIQRIH